MRHLLRSSVALLGLGLLAGCANVSGPQQASGKPWDIRAVVLTTYEIGQDSGDRAGEFQPWVEGEN